MTIGSHKPGHNVADGLGWICQALRRTGRGKHVGEFSYYHVSLLALVPGVDTFVCGLHQDLAGEHVEFNVVKLNRTSRISYLTYDDFAAAFPVLMKTVSCNLMDGTRREIDYSRRSNPPILHRKELLLPANHPLVPDAARLTNKLEMMGAFSDSKHIGTRSGWMTRLASIGLMMLNGRLQATPCPPR